MKPAKLVCPVCVERAPLRAVPTGEQFKVPLWRCDGCHGAWATREGVALSKRNFAPSHYVMVESSARQKCRACGNPLESGATRCRTCSAGQRVACPSCTAFMSIVDLGGVTLDVCRTCSGVWFDRGELGTVVKRHLRRLNHHFESPNTDLTPMRTTGVEIAANVLSSPDLVVLGVDVGVRAAHAAGEAVLHVTSAAGASGVVEAASAAGEVALGAGEAVGEVASAAGEAVLEVLGGIFS
jgi:Zn-finger nucleic acid-binding protein